MACHREPEKTDPKPDPPAPSGYDLTVSGASLVLRRDGGELLTLPFDRLQLGEIDAYDDTRSYDPFWPNEIDEEGVTWQHVESTTGEAPLTLVFTGGATATLSIAEVGEGRFALELLPTSSPRPVALVSIGLTVDPDEGFYGLGSALDHVNRRGSTRAAQLEVDPSTEVLSNEAHVHLPFFLGTTGWGFFARDDHPAVVEFATEADDRVTFVVGLGPDAPGGLSFELFAADHPLDVTARYWASTGLPRLPARWALGPLVWRDENDDQAQVEADLQAMRDLDLATSAIWIDRPYATGVNTFDFDTEQFPDPEGLIGLAHDLGFRVSLWHTPYVDEVEAQPLYDEAIREGYFPPVRPPVFIDWSSPVDFSNPDAFVWWQGNLDAYSDLGIEGYKLDYAEEVLVGALGGRLPWEFANGEDERTMHSGYQRLYHQVYAETLPADGGFLLCRTGAWGDQVHGPIIWPGDLDATLGAWAEPMVDRDGETFNGVGGLPASLIDGLSLGPSGFVFYGSDTGGYRHSPPDNETFVRWFEQTALSSVMQIGTSTNDVAWEPTADNGFDDQTLDSYREFVRLHLRLWPYLWTEAELVAQGVGRPLMRPLGLAHPELGVHPDDEYFLGDVLLVAPVVRRGERERSVVFPEGRFVDVFRGDVHDGATTGTTEAVAADLHDLPLFLVAGGVVPMLRPTIDTMAPTTRPSEVDSYATSPGLVYALTTPGPAYSTTLFDGTRLDQAPEDGALLSLRYTPGDEFGLGAVVQSIATPRPASVELDGASVDEVSDADAVAEGGGWAWSAAAGGTLWIAVPASGGRVVAR